MAFEHDKGGQGEIRGSGATAGLIGRVKGEESVNAQKDRDDFVQTFGSEHSVLKKKDREFWKNS